MDKLIYKNSLLGVYKSEKGKFKFVKIKHANYAVVLPFVSKYRILLEIQYRYVLGKELYEVPGGMMERGESATDAARRELAEETGYRAKDVRFMFKAYMMPGTDTSEAHFTIARDMTKGETHFDRNERIRTREISINQAVKLIKSNRITDGKTIAAILYYKYFYKG